MTKLYTFPSLFDQVPPTSQQQPSSSPEPLPPPPADAPPDWSERIRALDIRRSWIVEAPAGSGKTGLLIQRFLKLLADETVHEPEQVLAITFTRAATEEIRERLLAELERARTGAPARSSFDTVTRQLASILLERDRKLGWDLRNNPRRLNIRTIDSVCTEIMASLPVLSGGAGQLRPTEDAADLYREAARNTLLRLGGPDRRLSQALEHLLFHRDGNLANCETLIAEMLGSRDQWGELVPLNRRTLDDEYLEVHVLPQLTHALEQVLCSELHRLQLALPEPFLHQLTQFAADTSHRPGYNDNPSVIAVCGNRYNAPDARVSDLEHWRALLKLLVKDDGKWRKSVYRQHLGIELEKDEQTRLKLLLEEAKEIPNLLPAIARASRLPPAEYPQQQWRVVKALFHILYAALGELQLVFARHSQCDFVEGALQARMALREDTGAGDLRAALGLDLQHLLVDEMQDTSSGQYELVHLLTQHWPGERRTLFLVGDPKQSIYLFRQARVERFLQTMREHRLGVLPLGTLRLTSNFRSQAGLVGSFNEDFTRIFPPANQANDDTAISYTAAHASVPASPTSANRLWHLRTFSADVAPSAITLARQQHVQDIRSVIADWRSRTLPPGVSRPRSIAVLVRARNHLAPIIAALRGNADQPPIPYRAVKVEHLGDRPEILDLLSLTQAILHPAHRVAWLSILRAPWCGLQLRDLHILTGSDDPSYALDTVQHLLETRIHLLDPAIHASSARLLRIMQSAQQQQTELPLSQLVERTWRSLGGHLTVDPEQNANPLRFFELLDELETAIGRIDLAHLRTRLKVLYAEPTSAENAVELMTIHQAKGLEWDVVILPSLDRTTNRRSPKLLTWEELTGINSDAAQFLLAPIRGSDEPAKELNRWLNDLAAERETEEIKRLFYVACTRAREELHLFATVKSTESSEAPLPGKNTLLCAAWAAAQNAPHEEDLSTYAPVSGLPQPGRLLSLAAAAEQPEPSERPPQPSPMRLPQDIDPLTGLRGLPPIPSAPNRTPPSHTPSPEPPHASLPTRALGITVHRMLEWISLQLQAGLTSDTLRSQLPEWRLRINTLLRSEGVSPRDLPRLLHDTQTALSNTLSDPTGLWLLRANNSSSSEFSLTSALDVARPRTIRVDRLFTAGTTPLSDGHDCLWLIDYKTATHGAGGLPAFLASQRLAYTDQMEGYADVLKGHRDTTATRVALYFPMLREFVSWEPPSRSPSGT